jgi:putative sterol carrier protein
MFAHLDKAFQADKAKDWSTVMVWKVAGAGDWTLKVEGGKCSVASGPDPRASCVVEVSAETLAGVVQGTVDPNAAFMKGQIKATKVPDLGKFG